MTSHVMPTADSQFQRIRDGLADAETVRRYLSGRFVATARQMTGTPWVYSGYVFDRDTGRALRECCTRITRHRSNRVALACAEKALRPLLRVPGSPLLRVPDFESEEDR